MQKALVQSAKIRFNRLKNVSIYRYHILIFAVYMVTVAWIYLTYWAIVPDELWFFEDSFRIPLREILDRGAHLGYGQLYWLLLALLDDPLLVRLAALAAFLSIPAALWWNAHPSMRLLVMYLWIAMPMAWWTGKIAGPEVFSTAVGLWGVVATIKQRPALGGLCIGLAVGIKLTALPLAIFTLLPWLQERRYRAVFIAGGMVILGFVSANPLLLADPRLIAQNVFSATTPPENVMSHFFRVLSVYCVEWDMVQSGGLRQFAAPLSLLALLGISTLRHGPTSSISLMTAIAFLLSFLMFMTNGRFLGWYWFHVVVLIPVWVGTCTKAPKLEIFAVVALFAAANVPRIASEISTKVDQVRVLSTWEQTKSCVSDALENDGASQVIDYSEFTSEAQLVQGAAVVRFNGFSQDASHAVVGLRFNLGQTNEMTTMLQGATLIKICENVAVYRLDTSNNLTSAGAGE